MYARCLARVARRAINKNNNQLAQFIRASFASNASTDLQRLNLGHDENSVFMKWSQPETQNFSHQAILQQDECKVTTLASGLRVATEAAPYSETATIGVWIDAGSRYESKATNGTAHFLEHMAFKGTATRTAASLEQEIEDMGGHLNAYTSREQTTYYAKVLKKDIGKAVDILSDILQRSALEQRAIERERGVILREAEEVEKEIEEVLFDHLHATAFQHTGLGRTILGSAENVSTITRNDLEKYIKTHYTAPRMVIVGTGAVEHDQLVKLAESAFKDLPKEGVSTKDAIISDPGHFTGSEVRIRDDDMKVTNFAVAFKGASWTSPDAMPLLVMQAMLGSWDKNAPGASEVSSKLAQIFHSNDLGNSFMTFNTNYSDTGLFGVHVATEKNDALDDVAFAVMREFQNLIYQSQPEAVERAKQALKASLTLHQESSTSANAEEIGRQLLTYGKRMTRAELFARIDAVNAETVKETAWRYLRDQELAIASIGPTQFLPDYNWFRSSTYNNFY
jgi:processing peptidase subunit beta